jgi:hypothetical protein
MKDCSCSRLGLFMVLFDLLVPCAAAQKSAELVAGQTVPNQLVSSSLEGANFTDVTLALGLNFEHVASHTSRKYLIETMGSGVALFDYDNDGRLDIFVVNGASLSDPTPKGTIPQKKSKSASVLMSCVKNVAGWMETQRITGCEQKRKC